MRKPKIHTEFSTRNDCGMSTILAGHNTVANCINHSNIKNLDFISAGPIPPNPSELIMNQRMDDLLIQLKAKYDFIIIDNPPVGLVADGIKSLMKANYPIYVLKANSSKRSYISNIDHLIDDNNIHSLSIILNAVDIHNLSYGKTKSYTNGYGYGYYDDEKKQSFFDKLKHKLKLIRKS
jgi:capsular exopolysaccharide synthesis family protein